MIESDSDALGHSAFQKHWIYRVEFQNYVIRSYEQNYNINKSNI